MILAGAGTSVAEWLREARRGCLWAFAPRLAGVSMIVTIAACAAPPPRIENASAVRMVPTETAFALPAPGGPTVAAVLERTYANAVQQDILLSTSAQTSGQNMLRVQFFGPVAGSSTTRLRDGFLPIADVGSEMRKLIPGVRMVRSPYYVQNKYGPFGYAAGRAPSGDTCFYGWQGLTSTGSTQTLVGNKGSIQIRLRLCDQNASERRLLEAMYGFTITSHFSDRNWNPYGKPNAPDAGLGRGGQPVYPVGMTQFETVAPVASAPARRAPVSVQRQAEAAPQPPALPAPIGPVVPLPPGAERNDTQLTVPPAAQDIGANPVVVPPPPCQAAGTCK